jgi:hypothetical protein
MRSMVCALVFTAIAGSPLTAWADPPQPPTPLGPTGRLRENNVTFRWSNEADAGRHFLYVIDSRGVALYTELLPGEVTCAADECTYTPGIDLVGKVTWYVGTDMDGEFSGWSPRSTFHVGNPKPSSPKGPTGPVADRRPAYQWRNPDGRPSASYQLYIADSTGLRHNAIITDAECDDEGVCTAKPEVTLAGGAARWYVRRIDFRGVNSEWSRGAVFNVPKLPAPEQVGPLGEVETTRPTLEWTPVEGASSYQIHVVDRLGVRIDRLGIAASRCGEGVCKLPLPASLSPGRIAWYVRAFDAQGGSGEWSSYRVFAIRSKPGPTQSFPVADVQERTPRYEWEAQEGAASYTLHVRDQSGTRLRQTVPAADVCVPGAQARCVFKAPSDMVIETGDAWWWVRSVDKTGRPSAWSGPMKFRVGDEVPDSQEPSDGPRVPVPKDPGVGEPPLREEKREPSAPVSAA